MITVHIESDLQSIKDGIHTALVAMCLDAKVVYDLDGNTVIVAKDASLTAAKADIQDPIITPPAEIPAMALPSEIPAAQLEVPTDATIDLPFAPPEAVAVPTELPVIDPTGPTPMVPAMAEPAASPKVTGRVTLRNLSAVNQVSYEVDPNCDCSTLCVPNLVKRDSGLGFTYCDSSYGHPVADQGVYGDIANQNPQYTDTTIRVLAVFSGADGEQCIPILLKLIDGDDCRVVFGRDVEIPQP